MTKWNCLCITSLGPRHSNVLQYGAILAKIVHTLNFILDGKCMVLYKVNMEYNNALWSVLHHECLLVI
jgi:hypothetical protein